MDPQARLHLSLAGGRKTMSFHGGAALSLFARAQDELSHVLVHPQVLERIGEFWFPTRDDCWLDYKPREGVVELWNAKEGEARVELALVPFARVRDRLPRRLLEQPMRYAALVFEANAALGRARLALDLVTIEKSVSAVGLTSFTLEAEPFALYQLMAEWMRDQVSGAGPDGVGPEHRGWLSTRMFTHPEAFERNAVQRFAEIYEATFRTGGTKSSRAERLLLELTPAPANRVQRDGNERHLRGMKSRLLNALEEQFSQRWVAERFGALRDKSRGAGTVRRFGLRLLPDEIQISEG